MSRAQTRGSRLQPSRTRRIRRLLEKSAQFVRVVLAHYDGRTPRVGRAEGTAAGSQSLPVDDDVLAELGLPLAQPLLVALDPRGGVDDDELVADPHFVGFSGERRGDERS